MRRSDEKFSGFSLAKLGRSLLGVIVLFGAWPGLPRVVSEPHPLEQTVQPATSAPADSALACIERQVRAQKTTPRQQSFDAITSTCHFDLRDKTFEPKSVTPRCPRRTMLSSVRDRAPPRLA